MPCSFKQIGWLLDRCNKIKSNRSHGVSSNRLCSHKHSCRKVSAAATSEKVKRGRVPSAPQTAAPEDGSGRLADLPLAPVLPAPQLEIPDPDDDDEEAAFELPDDDIRSRGGYTPFEQLQFSDEDVTHELTVHVDASRSKCFQIWSDRANYLEWFDNIYQVRASSLRLSCCAYCSCAVPSFPVPRMHI